MKRFITVLLSIAVVAALLAGCSSKETEKETKTTSTTTTQSTTQAPTQQNAETNQPISGSIESFNAITLDNKNFTKEDFAKYDLTIINIWGTYCGPCINEMPKLAQFNKTLDKNINFITFCVDGATNPDAAKSIMDNAGMDATVLIGTDGDFYNVLSQAQFLPTTFFVDKNGKVVGEEIIGVFRGAEDYNDHISKALADSKE